MTLLRSSSVGLPFLALFTATALAQPQPAGPRRMSGPTTRPAIGLPVFGEMHTTRAQLDFYRVVLPSERLGEIDLDAMAGASPNDILKQLGALGEARILARMDQTGNLAGSLKLVAGKRTPTTQNVVVGQGKTTPSITYQEVGAVSNLLGRWRDEDHADVHTSIEMTDIVNTASVMVNDTRLPTFTTFKFDQQTTFKSGQPVMLMASDIATGDKDTLTVAVIARIKLTNMMD